MSASRKLQIVEAASQANLTYAAYLWPDSVVVQATAGSSRLADEFVRLLAPVAGDGDASDT
jgi:hypothetical protein